MSEIASTYDNEWRRGADKLRINDLEIGEELPQIVKGPLTLTTSSATTSGSVGVECWLAP